jgi:hypothetical protein
MKNNLDPKSTPSLIKLLKKRNFGSKFDKKDLNVKKESQKLQTEPIEQKKSQKPQHYNNSDLVERV